MSLLSHPADHVQIAHLLRRAVLAVWHVVTVAGTGEGYPARAVRRLGREIAPSLFRTRALRGAGYVVHRRVCRLQRRRPESRRPAFLRNRPLLEVLRRLAMEWPAGQPVRLASVGCGTGAELYSVLWAMRGARRDLVVHAIGADDSAAALATAGAARYAAGDMELSSLGESETAALFELEQDDRVVRPWIATGVEWLEADVRDEAALAQLAGQDIVLANDAFRHLADADAERCLERVARLVVPGGYVIACHMNADVRLRVMRRLGYLPVPVKIAAMHEAEPAALARWPTAYWAREPLDVRRADWIRRYAVIFQRPAWDVAMPAGAAAQPGTVYTDA
jgi:SAM-dependent methyltransferase